MLIKTFLYYEAYRNNLIGAGGTTRIFVKSNISPLACLRFSSAWEQVDVIVIRKTVMEPKLPFSY